MLINYGQTDAAEGLKPTPLTGRNLEQAQVGGGGLLMKVQE